MDFLVKHFLQPRNQDGAAAAVPGRRPNDALTLISLLKPNPIDTNKSYPLILVIIGTLNISENTSPFLSYTRFSSRYNVDI